MLLLMPKHPIERHGVDPDFQEEYDAALIAGFTVLLYDHDALLRGDTTSVLARTDHFGSALLRGWMMKYEVYCAFHDLLSASNIHLLNRPLEFKRCHHLPDWYSALAEHTPLSVWVDGAPPDLDECHAALLRLGTEAAIVKDYVKSWKHDWLDACFIPQVADSENARRVIGNFIRYQGSDLNGGVVLRAYENFRPLGLHPESGMPLSVEYRVFVLNNIPLAVIPYWPEISASEPFPMPALAPVLEFNPSPFFTVDLALSDNGEWRIVELGDAQVAGLQGLDPRVFYTSLRSAFSA